MANISIRSSLVISWLLSVSLPLYPAAYQRIRFTSHAASAKISERFLLWVFMQGEERESFFACLKIKTRVWDMCQWKLTICLCFFSLSPPQRFQKELTTWPIVNTRLGEAIFFFFFFFSKRPIVSVARHPHATDLGPRMNV